MVAKSTLRADAVVIYFYLSIYIYIFFYCGKGLSVACLIITHLSALNVCASTKPAGHIGSHKHMHARTLKELESFPLPVYTFIHYSPYPPRLCMHIRSDTYTRTRLAVGV